MRTKLLEALRCPACRGEFDLRAQVITADLNVQEGSLTCRECNRDFRIHQSVPRLILNTRRVQKTKRRFEYQWIRRLKGRHEPSFICYGYLVREFVDWLMNLYGTQLHSHGSDQWMLDAGCGSAEKTVQLAQKYPTAQVVGLDISGSRALSAAQHHEIANLHFVQADLADAPFQARLFNYALSIGVLHHTPSTPHAFAALAKLIQPGGGLLTWIYPLPSEDPFWAGFYVQRDQHFRGLGKWMPRPILMFFCRCYTRLHFERILKSFAQTAKTRARDYPFIPSQITKEELFESAVFLCFDNLAPHYQHRHSRMEVSEWYRQANFVRVRSDYPGFFFGSLAK